MTANKEGVSETIPNVYYRTRKWKAKYWKSDILVKHCVRNRLKSTLMLFSPNLSFQEDYFQPSSMSPWVYMNTSSTRQNEKLYRVLSNMRVSRQCLEAYTILTSIIYLISKYKKCLEGQVARKEYFISQHTQSIWWNICEISTFIWKKRVSWMWPLLHIFFSNIFT